MIKKLDVSNRPDGGIRDDAARRVKREIGEQEISRGLVVPAEGLCFPVLEMLLQNIRVARNAFPSNL
jgi:hypothetical protein